MEDLLLFGVVILLAVTAGASSFYYRRLRRLTQEYARAEALVSDIVISFNKQVQELEERTMPVLQKVMVSASRSNRIESELKEQESQTSQLSNKLDALDKLREVLPQKLESITQKVTEITRTQEELTQKLAAIEGKSNALPAGEVSIEAVIPFRQEKALAALTPTELSVLEILTNEGDKTAPEIKTRVNLTREHTARLMKKLYEAGYLERTTGRIPFAYKIKEEMRKILKKPEAKT